MKKILWLILAAWFFSAAPAFADIAANTECLEA